MHKEQIERPHLFFLIKAIFILSINPLISIIFFIVNQII